VTPLEGITVLDLSRVFAAPFATQMLSDLGAKVWKIESFMGDDTRRWGSHVFAAFNRGKNSLAINLKDPRGQAIIAELATKSDILIENFKTGDLRRYQLDYDRLNKINKRLIYLSLTGFGQTGPRKDQPGYDTVIQAMSGVMSVTGEPDRPPGRIGIAWIDVMAGLTTAIAILAAIQERHKSGVGQYIDLSLFDVGMMALVDVGQDYLQNGNIQSRIGSVTRNLSPAQPFKAADGWLVLAVGNDDQFVRMCSALQRPDLAADQRFKNNAARIENRSALANAIATDFEKHPRRYWLEKFQKHQVPLSPIHDIAEALNDKQVDARGIVWNVEDPSGKKIPLLGNPLQHMSRTPATAGGAPPPLGAHTKSVLSAELGFTDDTLNKLERDGVILTDRSER
jgi:crotonobetainyl-CoA:carnitine CoA-transferase CaiB-like acyl-CoA transferase